jgi:hypothetical protein
MIFTTTQPFWSNSHENLKRQRKRFMLLTWETTLSVEGLSSDKHPANKHQPLLPMKIRLIASQTSRDISILRRAKTP